MNYTHLTQEERYQIYTLLREGFSKRYIAWRLNRSPSTISREIKRTADNGKEFSLHEYVAEELEIDWYFADPYSAWQRGTNENTNGLIRQYIRKGSDLNLYTDEYILEITQRINHRPRKRLGFKSPSQVLCQQQGVALQMLI
jgi:IS30 family transposase